MTAALREHHNQLQDYLYEWGKKQQGLLEIMVTSTTRGSIDEGMLDMWVTGPAMKETADDFAKLSVHDIDNKPSPTSNLECGVLLSTAAKGEARPQGDGSLLRIVETRRSEVVNHFQVSLDFLQDLINPDVEDLKDWLSTAVEMLESELCRLDSLELFEQSPTPPELSTHVFLDELSKRSSQSNWRHKLGEVVTSHKFDFLSAVVIVCNCLVMGISTNYRAHHLQSSDGISLRILEIAFFVYYAVELLLRILHSGTHLFIGVDWQWNWFDVALVLVSVSGAVEEIIFVVGGDHSTMNVSFLRSLRLLKMARMARAIRVMKMFRHLRLILASTLGSMQAVLWAGLLVMILCYTASILFVNLLTKFLIDSKDQNLDIGADLRLDIEENWGSVIKGMNSLFRASTGGDDWFNVARPLWEAGSGCYILFVLYMGFFLIVVLNTFSSLFVQSVMENQAKDEAGIVDELLVKKDEYVAQLKDLFSQIEDDGDGAITINEFINHANDPKLHAWADHLGIDLTDSKHFFEVLSHNGSLKVDLETFVVGCIKLRGQAKQVDVLSVLQLSKQIHKKIDACYSVLHMGKTLDEPSRRKCEDTAEDIYAGKLLPILTHICRTQGKILAECSSQAKVVHSQPTRPQATLSLPPEAATIRDIDDSIQL